MSPSSSNERKRILDPVLRLSEILFGLIMVLSFTGSISIASSDDDEVRSVLIGAIGCNLAWGIIDAVMYLMMTLIERGRGLSIARAVRSAPDPEHGRRLIAEALPENLGDLFESDALEGARDKLVSLPAVAERPHLGRTDWLGAVGVFLLVFLSTFPVVVPFMLFSPLHVAMRISNLVAIVLLYVAGHLIARYAGLNPVRTGLVMVMTGAVLRGITIALGG